MHAPENAALAANRNSGTRNATGGDSMASVIRLVDAKTGKARRFWTVRYIDHTGRLRQQSARTTEKRVAEQLARRIEEQESKLRAGLLTPAEVTASEQSRRPLRDHVEEYLAHCAETGQAPRAVMQKRRTLSDLVASGIGSLAELTPQRVRRYLSSRRTAGDSRRRRQGDTEPLSARTWNALRQQVLAFANWCQAEGRILRHELGGAGIPKMREETDRRRQRASLTPAEVSALLQVASGTPRAAVYLVATHTGLRRSELAGLRWIDVDAEGGTVTVQASLSKSRKAAELPVHPEAMQAMLQLWSEDAGPQDRVFAAMPRMRDLYADLAAAGIQAIDADGRPVLDAGGRIVDFHSLRGTAATNLVRAGVTQLHLARLMRHADIKTTAKHYVGLGMSDMRDAVERIDGYLPQQAPALMTGTDGGITPPQVSSKPSSVGVHSGASAGATVHRVTGGRSSEVQAQARTGQALLHGAAPACTRRHQAGEGTRTLDIQLGKVNDARGFTAEKQRSASEASSEPSSVACDPAEQLLHLIRRWPELDAGARHRVMQAAGVE
jgi:integrase